MPSFSAQADFYSWVGPDGRRQVSNVPLSGFTKEGGIRQAYDPRSIVYQHAKMLESIAAQSQEISRQINATRGRSDAPGVSGQLTAPRRAAPREGVMNLVELIELEKRGGRYPESSQIRP